MKISVNIIFFIFCNSFLYSQNSVKENVDDIQNEIEWHIDRKLVWSDFKAKPPNNQANVAAITNCGFKISVQTYPNGDILKIEVQIVFDCAKSWVREETKNKEGLLEHEQSHFDLCEIYARRIRKETIGLKKKSDSDQLIKNIFKVYKERQNRYDEETNHGIDKEKQKVWQNKIDKELLKLNEFSK